MSGDLPAGEAEGGLLSPAQLERILATTRMQSVEMHVTLDDGRVILIEVGKGMMSYTYGGLPDDMDFLANPVRITFRKYYGALVFRPDDQLSGMMRIREFRE